MVEQAYRPSTLAAQLSLQAAGESPGHTRLVGVKLGNNSTEDTDTGNESAEQDGAETRLEVGVGLSAEDTEDVVVFVDRLAVVAAFLLVPPVAVWVAELALLGGRVGVLAVL